MLWEQIINGTLFGGGGLSFMLLDIILFCWADRRGEMLFFHNIHTPAVALSSSKYIIVYSISYIHPRILLTLCLSLCDSDMPDLTQSDSDKQAVERVREDRDIVTLKLTARSDLRDLICEI